VKGLFARSSFLGKGDPKLAGLAGDHLSEEEIERRVTEINAVGTTVPHNQEAFMLAQTGDITLLLNKWRAGSRTAENELFALAMPNLRRLARYLMKSERKGHTMQPTELVDQIYLRLVGAKDRDWASRQHFFAIAARAMRWYLIDHARGRPDGEFVAFEGVQDLLPADSGQLDLAVTVGRLLDQLAEAKPEWCTLVEVKYFLGLTDQEAAEILGLKVRTMQRMWRDARQWLFEQMESGNASQSAGR
jgi:RNA polymerase sigma factor (TIGR02999 family)